MRVRGLALNAVALVALVTLSCHDNPRGSIQASVVVVQTGGSCLTQSVPGASCSVTRTVSVTVEEVGGRDVSLQSVSGVLWDTRAMQDMHAQPAALSSADIRQAEHDLGYRPTVSIREGLAQEYAWLKQLKR